MSSRDKYGPTKAGDFAWGMECFFMALIRVLSVVALAKYIGVW